MSLQSQKKFKTFTYTTGLTWINGKIGAVSSEWKPLMHISSPPEFKGEPGYWTPEDLFVASVEMCQMLTFLGLAQKQNLPLVSYKSSASGTLEFLDGGYKFTRIEVTPRIVVEDPATEDSVKGIVHEAHKRCLIANSITAIVHVQPEVVVQELVVVGETPEVHDPTTR
jgi:organic hydroperoxide reductase OsmC/OhrA